MSTTTNPADATSAEAGATPVQTTPVSPAADPIAATPPATGEPDALGEGGKKALEQERRDRKAADDRAKALQVELDTLKAASLSDSERAIADAKKAGTAEATAKYEASIRRSEVRAALTAAGINGTVLDLAVRADEFSALTISDDGEVEGLEAAVSSFKATRADLFTRPVTPGTADGGAQGTKAGLTKDRIKSMSPAEYEANHAEVMAWMTQQK